MWLQVHRSDATGAVHPTHWAHAGSAWLVEPEDLFMRPLLFLSLDPVKNVRLCWATVILPHLRKVGRLGQNRLVLAAAVSLRSTMDREVHRVLEEAKLPEVSDEEPGGPDGAPSERPE
ncbi:Hypothetical protein (Fragment) [Durusdinium trenchii]|uniref:Uncharacterized protein n=1 Tax=Durusdinium trenchii TaxID=1381693 RepID=A0ABP0IBN8_9DINO